MAVARRCDRCGGFYDLYNIKSVDSTFRDRVSDVNADGIWNGMQFIHSNQKGPTQESEVFDLCRHCNHALKLFMTGHRIENESMLTNKCIEKGEE